MEELLIGKGFTTPLRVERVREYARMRGTGYRNIVFKVIDGNKKQYEVVLKKNVVVPAFCSPMSKGLHFEDVISSIRPWAEVESEAKAFRDMVSWRAEMSRVPFEVASVTRDIKHDDDAHAILSDLSVLPRVTDETIAHELGECGIVRRCDAIAAFIGEEMVKALGLRTSQSRSKTVANYLLTK